VEATFKIHINPAYADGVDRGYVELSLAANDTVEWVNEDGVTGPSQIVFGHGTPFSKGAFDVPTGPLMPSKKKSPKHYQYSVICGEEFRDPGLGVRA